MHSVAERCGFSLSGTKIPVTAGSPAMEERWTLAWLQHCPRVCECHLTAKGQHPPCLAIECMPVTTVQADDACHTTTLQGTYSGRDGWLDSTLVTPRPTTGLGEG